MIEAEEDKVLMVTDEWSLEMLEYLNRFKQMGVLRHAADDANTAYQKLREAMGAKGQFQDEYFRGQYAVNQVPVKDVEYLVKASFLVFLQATLVRIAPHFPKDYKGKSEERRLFVDTKAEEIKNWLLKAEVIEPEYTCFN